MAKTNKSKETGTLPNTLHYSRLRIDTRNLVSSILKEIEPMPRIQKTPGGVAYNISQAAQDALKLAITISGYGARSRRIGLLHEFISLMNFMKDELLIAEERGYLKSTAALDRLAIRANELAERAVGYTRGLEHEPTKGAQ